MKQGRTVGLFREAEKSYTLQEKAVMLISQVKTSADEFSKIYLWGSRLKWRDLLGANPFGPTGKEAAERARLLSLLSTGLGMI